jgi:hypothetical protein
VKTMKQLLLHLWVVLAAGTAGWMLGSRRTVDLPSLELRFPSPPEPLQLSSSPFWHSQISAVRAVPGAAAEAAWVKWALAVPDTDIPGAISKLNPRCDLHALRCLYSRWVKLDPQAAWTSFRRSSIPPKSIHYYPPDEDRENNRLSYGSSRDEPRSEIAARMLASWLKVDPQAAAAFAAKLRVPNSLEAKEVPVASYELKRLLEKYSNDKQPEAGPAELSAAAAAALTIPDAENRRIALHEPLRKWLTGDPTAACQWIQGLPPEQRKLLSFDQLRLFVGRVPAPTRAELLTPMIEERNLSAEDLARVVRSDPRTAPPELREISRAARNAAEAVKEWATQDPVAARGFVEALPDNDLKALLAGEAAGALAPTDAPSAIALLNHSGGDQEVALKGFMRGWVESNVKASLDWAGSLEDLALRDACFEIAAQNLTRIQTDQALEIARTITDTAIRKRIYQTISASLSWNPGALEQLQSRFPSDDWRGSHGP